MLTLGLFAAFVLCGCGLDRRRGVEPNAREAEAVGAIETVGGRVTIDDGRSDRPVTAVNLAFSQVTNAGWSTSRD